MLVIIIILIVLPKKYIVSIKEIVDIFKSTTIYIFLVSIMYFFDRNINIIIITSIKIMLLITLPCNYN